MTQDLSALPIRLGISSCLLGEQVRFDGGHKRDTSSTKRSAGFSNLFLCALRLPSGSAYRDLQSG